MRCCSMCKEAMYNNDGEIMTYGGDVKYLCSECCEKVNSFVEQGNKEVATADDNHTKRIRND